MRLGSPTQPVRPDEYAGQLEKYARAHAERSFGAQFPGKLFLVAAPTAATTSRSWSSSRI